MNSIPPLLPGFVGRRLYVFLKVASIGVLILLLHIPLAMTHSVLVERRGYQAEATAAIASVWGDEQRLVGPVLAVPYEYETKVVRSRIVAGRPVEAVEADVASATAFFLPETLAVTGTVAPELRHRGIYASVVYSASARFTGSFRPDFAAAGIEASRVDWRKARVYFGVSDVRGVRSIGPLKLGTGEAAFEPSDGSVGALLPLVAKLAVDAAGPLEFAVAVEVQGSRRLAFAPVGKATTVALESAWPDPSFDGGALPVERRVTAEGFTARWQRSHLSRGFAQHWSDRQVNVEDLAKKIESASFGVRFARPVDGYSMTERAQKYAVLFFVLTFTVFFLFEATSPLRIHWLQYAMVGAALCLFFVGFLALSEFWPTAAAYGVAASACTLMISLYAHTFLKTGRRTVLIFGGLGVTYAYLYFVLRSQDYALIAGAAALFIALGSVMYFTRRIDWGALDIGEARQT